MDSVSSRVVVSCEAKIITSDGVSVSVNVIILNTLTVSDGVSVSVSVTDAAQIGIVSRLGL